MDARLIGSYGEVYTARFLRCNGYDIIQANYRCRMGEIDIIASDGKYICFVEVKTRDENAVYSAKEAVDTAKQRKIVATASFYLSNNKTKLQPRFDVAEVYMKDGEAVDFKYIKNAYNS